MFRIRRILAPTSFLVLTTLAISLLSVASCSSFGRSTQVRSDSDLETSGSIEDRLGQTVHSYVKASQGGNRESVIKRKPYYLKEYVEYPEGVKLDKVTMQETESRTVPYIADVELTKVRIATDLKRSRKAAKRETAFYRETGIETLTFEYRSGEWRRVGSLFVAELVEEQIGGEWVKFERKAPVVIYDEQLEDNRGVLRRFWSAVSGI